MKRLRFVGVLALLAIYGVSSAHAQPTTLSPCTPWDQGEVRVFPPDTPYRYFIQSPAHATENVTEYKFFIKKESDLLVPGADAASHFFTKAQMTLVAGTTDCYQSPTVEWAAAVLRDGVTKYMVASVISNPMKDSSWVTVGPFVLGTTPPPLGIPPVGAVSIGVP